MVSRTWKAILALICLWPGNLKSHQGYEIWWLYELCNIELIPLILYADIEVQFLSIRAPSLYRISIYLYCILSIVYYARALINKDCTSMSTYNLNVKAQQLLLIRSRPWEKAGSPGFSVHIAIHVGVREAQSNIKRGLISMCTAIRVLCTNVKSLQGCVVTNNINNKCCRCIIWFVHDY